MAVLQCVTVCYSCVTTAPPAAELMMHKNKIITFTLIHKTEGGTTRRNMEGGGQLYPIRKQEVEASSSLIGSFLSQRKVAGFGGQD